MVKLVYAPVLHSKLLVDANNISDRFLLRLFKRYQHELNDLTFFIKDTGRKEKLPRSSRGNVFTCTVGQVVSDMFYYCEGPRFEPLSNGKLFFLSLFKAS